MKSLNKATPYIVGFAILGGLGSTWLIADPDLPDTAPRSTTSKAKDKDGADIVDSKPKLDPTKATVAEMSVGLGSLDAQVKDDARHVLHLQALARKQKDVIKLNCINDRLVQLKAQERIFDSAHVELVPLLDTRNPPNEANRIAMFTEVSVGAANVKKLRIEADTCIGEPEIAGETANGFTGPTLTDDPMKGDVFGAPVEAPAYASPYN